MICITGDMHADLDRFKDKRIKKLKRNDALIVCGDFGFLWDGSKKEKRILKKIGRKRYYTLFVDGCHENFDLLNEYQETNWCGGKVHPISGKLLHLKRGEIYDIQGKKIFAFGGGHSDDMDIRRYSNTWWEAENPTFDEINSGKEHLKDNDNTVDYIVTHEPPATIKEFLQTNDKHLSEMGIFFEDMKKTCKFKTWFFGKYHINKKISSQYEAMFTNVVVIK